MNTSLIPKILLAALICLPLTAMATIYKWVDEEGNTNYSEIPPPNTKAKRLKAPPPPPVDPKQAMEELREKAKAFNERRENRQKTSQQIAEDKTKNQQQKERCEQLRQNLDTMTAHTRIQKQTENGEYVTLDDKQRLEAIEETKKRIDKEC